MLSLKLGVLQIPKLDLMISHVFISVLINSSLPFYFHPVTLTQDSQCLQDNTVSSI